LIDLFQVKKKNVPIEEREDSELYSQAKGKKEISAVRKGYFIMSRGKHHTQGPTNQ